MIPHVTDTHIGVKNRKIKMIILTVFVDIKDKGDLVIITMITGEETPIIITITMVTITVTLIITTITQVM